MDKGKEPWSFVEEDRDRVHLLLRLDVDAMKQMISSARQENTGGKGDGLERAAVVASLIYDGFEYFDRDVMAIRKHSRGDVTGGGLTTEWKTEGKRLPQPVRVPPLSAFNQNPTLPQSLRGVPPFPLKGPEDIRNV